MRRIGLHHRAECGAHRVGLDEAQERHEIVEVPSGTGGLLTPRCRRRHGLGRRSCLGCRPGRRTLGHRHGLIGRFGHPGRSGMVTIGLGALRVTDGLAAGRAAHRRAVQEHPPDVRNGLASDESTLVEEPFVLAMQFLERIVGQHRGLHLVGDGQHEGVTSADRSGRRGDEFVVLDGLVEIGDLFGIDTVPEGGVDDHRDQVAGIFRDEGQDRFVQLSETRHRSPLGGEVRSVNDHVSGHTASESTTRGTRKRGFPPRWLPSPPCVPQCSGISVA